MKYFRDGFLFQVGDVPFVGLDACDDIFVYVITGQLQLVGQVALGHVMFLAEFGQAFADEIFFAGFRAWFWHDTHSSCVEYCGSFFEPIF